MHCYVGMIDAQLINAAAYAELKRRLANHHANAEAEPRVKDSAVDLIRVAAEKGSVVHRWCRDHLDREEIPV